MLQYGCTWEHYAIWNHYKRAHIIWLYLYKMSSIGKSLETESKFVGCLGWGIQPVHPKGNQSWIFIGRTDAEAETPILWPPDAKSWLVWKDTDAGKDWRQEEKGRTEDEMVGWNCQLHAHEFELTLGVGDGQRPGMLQSTGSQRVGHDWATELNWTGMRGAGRLSLRGTQFLFRGWKCSKMDGCDGWLILWVYEKWSAFKWVNWSVSNASIKLLQGRKQHTHTPDWHVGGCSESV